MCYNVNVPQCSVSPCQTGTCNQQPGLSVCSQNQFNTNTVCPSGGLPGQSCQQIRQPVCGQGGPGGSCNPQTQQCCSYKWQKVCRNVPQLEKTMVTRPLPGNVFWREECKMVDYNVTKER